MSGTVFLTLYSLPIFFGQLEPTLETEHFYIVGVNSIRRRYHTRGHISIEQIQTTYERLQQGPADKIKLVVFHQPFIPHLMMHMVLKIVLY